LHTLAIGVPGSAYQDMVRPAAEMAASINDGLRTYASSSAPSNSNIGMSYVDFPFPYVENDERWSEDGLHPSEMGYRLLGEAIAIRVKEILNGV
jgi:lysophospholipase L1-like esterase